MTRALPIRCTMVSVLVLRGPQPTPELLLVRRASAYLDGVWSYVAGHIAHGETGRQTALRELREETGLRPETLHATSFCEQFYSPQGDCIEVVPSFVARAAEGAEVQLNSEHSAFRWVPFVDAAGLVPFGSQRDLLAHVRRNFIEREPSPFLRIELG